MEKMNMDMHMQMYFVNTYQCVWLFDSFKTTTHTPVKYWTLIIVALVFSIFTQFLKSLKIDENSKFSDSYKVKGTSSSLNLEKIVFKGFTTICDALLMLLIMTFNTGIFIVCILG